jgi:hypothetical protein
MLDQLHQQWLILWVEDRVLAKPVDTSRISHLTDVAQSRGAAYLRLIAVPPFAPSEHRATGIGELPKGTPYRVSITVALWNRRALRSLLSPGESAWQLEHCGTLRADRLDAPFLACSRASARTPPIQDTHLIIKGKLLRDARSFLLKEALIHHLAHRKLQSLSSHLYTKAVIAYWNLTGVPRSRHRPRRTSTTAVNGSRSPYSYGAQLMPCGTSPRSTATPTENGA